MVSDRFWYPPTAGADGSAPSGQPVQRGQLPFSSHEHDHGPTHLEDNHDGPWG